MSTPREAPPLHVLTTDDTTGAATRWLLDAIRDAIAATGRCRLGLSGGSTPGPIFERLAAALPAETYDELAITWVDERHLPVGHPDTNLYLAQRHWFERAAAPPRFVPMIFGGAPEQDLATFERRLRGELDGGLDVALLGAGPDGHIASLFPGHPALEAEGLCALVRDSPKPPPTRITLTMATLCATPSVLLVARGASKADALGRARRGDQSLPLARLRPLGDYRWILDPQASVEFTTRLPGAKP